MIIQHNNIAAKAYTSYAGNLNNLQKSAERLASGDKFASAGDGAGELGVADKLKLKINGTNAILTTMSHVSGYTATQDEILSQVSDITNRMYELAATAVDPTKSAAERTALNDEFRALSSEIVDVAADAKYNGTRLFSTSTTARVGLETTDVISLSAVELSLLTFGTFSVNTTANASAALTGIDGRVGSLAALRTKARTNHARIERTMQYTKDYAANLANSHSAIRNVDLAEETGEFTKNQVILSASQSILSQANGLPQTAARFLP